MTRTSRYRSRIVVGCVTATALVCGCTAKSAETPRPPSRATGQLDQRTTVTGQLRADLLEASEDALAAKAPDPRQPIELRSSLRPTAAKRRVLMLAFRSRTGTRCIGITAYRPGAIPSPPGCLATCRRPLCAELLVGGPLPKGVVVLAGLAGPRVDEIVVFDRAGASTRYRVSSQRLGSPPVRPVLVRVRKIQSVVALVGGERVQEIRFPRLVYG
jgi:hypothetical protein